MRRLFEIHEDPEGPVDVDLWLVPRQEWWVARSTTGICVGPHNATKWWLLPRNYGAVWLRG